MANRLTVNYTQDVLDQMRCSGCKGYLSCSPIRLLPDGTCICGRCSPANMDVQVYRNLPLEILFKQLSFPCQYKERGCTTSVVFDLAADHESKCIYRSFACPLFKSCGWEEFDTTEISKHFIEQHPGHVKNDADFKFNMNEDAEGVFITKKDNLEFVIKYLYVVDENCLKYDVRYFGNAGKNEGTYKLRLSNHADYECNFNLKTNKCLVFDKSFYEAQNAQILKLSKFVELLDNPDTIKVTIDLAAIESCGTSVNQEIKLVDYKLLDTIRCQKCNNYLIPPLFDVKSHTICCICAKLDSGANLSTNLELIKLISQINYPCQWRDCNFIGNSDNIQRHNLFCQFRLYRCRSKDCKAFITLATAADHLQSHNDCAYLPDGIHKFQFPHSDMLLWMPKNGILIAINQSSSYEFTLLTDFIPFTVTVHFEHEHCNLKSMPFVLVSNEARCIYETELQSCFEPTDEMLLHIDDCTFK